MCSRVATPSRAQSMGLAVFLALLTAFWTWWAWKQGAYFGTVFYPGAIGAFVLLAVLFAAVPLGIRIAGPAMVALTALLGLGIWTLIAFSWSPDRAVAISDAYKVFLYAAVFAVGIWTCRLLGRRMVLALAPVAVAGVLVGVGTTVTLATGHDLAFYLHRDATLRFPIGYRNAEAAFFMISIWALLILAVEGEVRWQVRAMTLAATTMLLELVVLAQSRGSLPAALVAYVVYLILVPNRLRANAYLLLAIIPAIIALPTLLDVFHHGHIVGILPLLRSAARAIALTSLLSLLLAVICLGALEPRVRRIGPIWGKRISRTLTVTVVIVVGVGLTTFFAEHGGPIHFLDQRIAEFNRGVSPSFHHSETRFGLNITSERGDLWRVASDEFVDHPFGGGGPGSFQFRYLRDRRTAVTPKDPHSIEFLMLSELGLPGFILLVSFLGATTVAAVRSRRLGRAQATLVAGALTSGAYWLIHSSYDWFWHYPALTAPTVFLLGTAVAPGLRGPGRALHRLKMIPLALLLVLVLGAIPLYFSERYMDRALSERGNAAAAYRDLDRAASLNPWDLQPLLYKGIIASENGDRTLALASFNEARKRVPDNYAPHYFIAFELAKSHPAMARRQLAIALEMNPKGPKIHIPSY